MSDSPNIAPMTSAPKESVDWRLQVTEVILLVLLFFIYAGDHAPMVNEAHYWVKAKNFWQPEWCANDLFTSSGKAHTTFYFAFGWLTQIFSLSTSAWIGRIVGWGLIAIGLQRLSMRLIKRPFASLGVGLVWIAGIEHGNLAGEWVIGGSEAKVPAYGFVLMALAEMVDRRWHRVWPLLGIASAFHVLSGGWSVLGAMLVWFATERKREDRIKLFTPALFLGGAVSLLGLLPAVWLMVGVPPQDSIIAAKIYSYKRISHHLLPANFPPEWYIRHGTLVTCTAIAFLLSWRDEAFRRIRWFVIAAILIAVAGLLVGALPPHAPSLAAKLLRYYWFRLTDAIVPLGFGLAIAALAFQNIGVKRIVGVIVLLIAAILVGDSSYKRAQIGVPPSASHRLLGFQQDATVEEQRMAFRDWLAVCTWARYATPKDEVFLTPRHQQTFKWYSHRAEVVNWKDVPQDAKSLKEWYGRFNDVFPRFLNRMRVSIQYTRLRRYRKDYGTRFMIVDRRIAGKNLPLARVYPIGSEQNRTYAVYELPHK